MATIAPRTAAFKALVSDLYGDRTPSAAPDASPAPGAPVSEHGAGAFAAQVAHVTACAHRKMGASHAARIDGAAAIVLAGGVDAGTVQSQHRPDTWYDVVGNVCNCEDYERHATHTNGYVCKHVIATWLARYVAQRLPTAAAHDDAPAHDDGDADASGCFVPLDDDGVPCEAVHARCPGHGAAPVAALPEAAASVNVRILVHGREVQWTLRGNDETALAGRLEALLARYPAEGRAHETAAPREADETPRCPVHHTAKASTKAPGTWYCPSRSEDDDAFCTWRHPAKGTRR